MPILRGFTGDIRTMPPDIYVNELPVVGTDSFEMPDFVLGFVGEFDRGPVDSYIYASETPAKRLDEVVKNVFGKASDTGAKGNQLLTHLKNAGAKKAAFVRVLGAGHKAASISLEGSQSIAEDSLLVEAAYSGTYANIFTAEVLSGNTASEFTLKLHSDLDGFETYQNLTMDPEAENYAVAVVNAKSLNFRLKDLNPSETDYLEKRPANISATQLLGGSDGAALTSSDYIGTIDSGTGKRTGLKLLELCGKQVTDAAYVDFSAPEADKALADFAYKYNVMCYIGTNGKKVGAAAEDVISYRKTFDTDFCQMAAGRHTALTGAKVSAACLSSMVHAVGRIEDSGLARECLWIGAAEEELDFDQLTLLYQNQISCFTLKPSETKNGALGFRMGSDYTLAQTDAGGNVIADNENRKVNKRRLNSWIENSLFFAAAKWQGRALTTKMKRDAELRIRTFFDELKAPTVNPLDTPKIENYSITFDDAAGSIDSFVQNINVKHFNTAEWILLNYQGGTNVEVAK